MQNIRTEQFNRMRLSKQEGKCTCHAQESTGKREISGTTDMSGAVLTGKISGGMVAGRKVEDKGSGGGSPRKFL